MARGDGLRDKPLGSDCVHLCVDMQNLFAEGSEWHTPWMKRVLPFVEQLVEAHPAETIFTRFIPVAHPGEGEGTWKEYYQRWSKMTLEALPPSMVDLVPQLARFVPPATVIDKGVYSPWLETGLDEMLRERGTNTLVISGAETDVCVLAAVMGAVDRGYRIVVPKDALCSSSDAMHDALLGLYSQRYGGQVEVGTVEQILRLWK
ncbi:isochorismatase family cysteine hydrolase [Pseudoroseomonas ludipueritiae]|uniref:Cysteine hydrolase n=1 Tax=Pseudoroseomonas ludipueritiae TaxID=198093 RepID=A0ABR7R5T5_9PROT|nr:isochorismatase family cysteine hydrolase [Pseudoroseomonas ludipueritiae]MBC9177108.1 cysteine hydrolase [Pseudoroseomonas ludipueritiae]